MLLVLGCAFIASCGDNDMDNPYAHESVVKVTSALPLFEAEGGTAKFDFSAPGDVVLISESEWVSASVENNSVVVTVPVNSSYEGRSARIYLKYGEDEVAVNVQQKGMKFFIDAPASKIVSDEASSETISFTSIIPVEVSTSADWLTVTADENSLTYSVSENTTGHFRGGYVYYACGSYRDSIQVVQGSAADLVGEYVLSGFTTNLTKLGTIKTDATIEQTGTNALVMKLKYSSYNWEIPLTFDTKTLTVSVRAGQKVGKMSTFDVKTTIYHAAKPDSLGLSSNVSMTGNINVVNGATVCEFVDNGSLSYVFSKVDSLKADVLAFSTYKDNSRRGLIANFAFRKPVLTEKVSSSARRNDDFYIWKP